MEPRTTVGTDAADARYARESLAEWLRTGRTNRKLTLEDVAKVTKIQPRILEKLESGQLDGLPADVFVKGFVRSFAKCVGLDESEALQRYGACQAGAASPVAKALVESMGVAAARRAEAVAKAKAEPTKLVDAPAVTVESPVVETPVVEAAPALEANVVSSSIEAFTETPASVEPAVSDAIVDPTPSMAVGSSAEIVLVAVEQPKKKRASRKKNPNATPRSRKKKSTPGDAVQAAPSDAPAAPLAQIDASHATAQLDASAHVDEDAQTTQIERFSLDSIVEATPGPFETGPIAKTDAASFDVTSIEAKTDANDTSDESLGIVDGAVSELALAEGSDRMRASAIAAAAESTGSPNGGNWQPTMPPIATTSIAPWRRPHISTSAAPAYVVPTLVIDDADPDSADREREGRDVKEHRLSFLPPILLDREDRSARQGGLTLAVIILLIAATLTLSYLMRRPSPSGDGVTMIDGQSTLLS